MDTQFRSTPALIDQLGKEVRLTSGIRRVVLHLYTPIFIQVYTNRPQFYQLFSIVCQVDFVKLPGLVAGHPLCLHHLQRHVSASRIQTSVQKVKPVLTFINVKAIQQVQQTQQQKESNRLEKWRRKNKKRYKIMHRKKNNILHPPLLSISHHPDQSSKQNEVNHQPLPLAHSTQWAELADEMEELDEDEDEQQVIPARLKRKQINNSKRVEHPSLIASQRRDIGHRHLQLKMRIHKDNNNSMCLV